MKIHLSLQQLLHGQVCFSHCTSLRFLLQNPSFNLRPNHLVFTRNQTMAFNPGDPVEICSKEQGFLGSYFAATVLSSVGENQFLVEYSTLLTDDEKNRLKEIVDTNDMRPPPPEIRAIKFSVLDVVDVYDNDGWWIGRVTGRIGLKHFVYFDTTGEEIAFPFYRLRVHQEWKDGKWVPYRNKELKRSSAKRSKRRLNLENSGEL